MKRIFEIILVFVVIGVGVFLVFHKKDSNNLQWAIGPDSIVNYSCDGGKTIVAAYFSGTDIPGTVDTPPVPGGTVNLKFSDNSNIVSLHQTISADGVRYSNSDESFVFWNKGNGALVLENNREKSYIGCIEVASDPGGLPQVYSNGSAGFSIRYPARYAVDENYQYQQMGPGKEISGVKFTIDPNFSTSSNLASDSYVSVEEIPNTQTCSTSLFLDGPTLTVKTVKKNASDNNTEYSVASTTGAGAGNRYEETVYAISGTNPCIAVRYMVHYGVIENYGPGIKEFDHKKLLDQFDDIRRSLVVAQ